MHGRQAWTLILFAIALLGAAGCIGDSGEPGAEGLEPDGVEGGGSAGEGDKESVDGADLETRSQSVQGSFVASLGTPVVGSNNLVSTWDTSVNLPNSFEGGTLTLTWDGTGVGGMLLNLYEGDREDYQSFEAGSSPFVVELEPDDPRVLEATEVGVYAAGDPPSVYADVEWNVEFSLLVAMGDDDARNDPEPDAR